MPACALGYTTITIAILGFLGLGLPPPRTRLGQMIAAAQPFGVFGANAMLIPAARRLLAGAGLQHARRRPAGDLAEGLNAMADHAHAPILECENLSISYFTRQGEMPAVVDFNLKVMPGEAVGVVGESGCGKSTVALAIMCYLGKNGAHHRRLDEVPGPRHDHA